MTEVSRICSEIVPDYLIVNLALGVVICGQHGSCYTPSSLNGHLTYVHHIKRRERLPILSVIEERFSSANIQFAQSIESIPIPIAGGIPIAGLPIHSGFRCRWTYSRVQNIVEGLQNEQCSYISTNERVIKEHIRVKHAYYGVKRGRPRRDQQQNLMEPSTIHYEKIWVQSLLPNKKSIHYFMVKPADSQVKRLEMPFDKEAAIRATLEKDRLDTQRELMEDYGKVQAVGHISEYTPWLRSTGFHTHLRGIMTATIPTAIEIASDDEPELKVICESMNRILRSAMRDIDLVRKSRDPNLNTKNSQLLYSWNSKDTAKKPIAELKAGSKEAYIKTWQQMICYFYRVVKGTIMITRSTTPSPPTSSGSGSSSSSSSGGGGSSSTGDHTRNHGRTDENNQQPPFKATRMQVS